MRFALAYLIESSHSHFLFDFRKTFYLSQNMLIQPSLFYLHRFDVIVVIWLPPNFPSCSFVLPQCSAFFTAFNLVLLIFPLGEPLSNSAKKEPRLAESFGGFCEQRHIKKGTTTTRGRANRLAVSTKTARHSAHRLGLKRLGNVLRETCGRRLDFRLLFESR